MRRKNILILCALSLFASWFFISKSMNFSLIEKIKIFLKELRIVQEAEVVILDDFEVQERDFGWETNGYVYLKLSTLHSKNGKGVCQATFTIPSDFESATKNRIAAITPIHYSDLPTPNTPKNVSITASIGSFSKITSTANTVLTSPVGVWRPTMSLGLHTKTSLLVFDWVKFNYFKLDTYNPQNTFEDLEIRVIDENGYTYSGIFNLPAGSEQTIKLNLDALREKKLDLKHIKCINLSLDTTHEEKNVVLFFDRLILSKN